MSWNRKNVKKKYLRKSKHATYYEDEYAEGIFEWDDCPCCQTNPSMYEIRWGQFLTALAQLKIREAKTLLNSWYW